MLDALDLGLLARNLTGLQGTLEQCEGDAKLLYA